MTEIRNAMFRIAIHVCLCMNEFISCHRNRLGSSPGMYPKRLCCHKLLPPFPPNIFDMSMPVFLALHGDYGVALVFNAGKSISGTMLFVHNKIAHGPTHWPSGLFS